MAACMRTLPQVVKWRSALLKLSEDGVGGLPPIKQALLDATNSSETLDVVFESPGLGQVLAEHAKGSTSDKVIVQICPCLHVY